MDPVAKYREARVDGRRTFELYDDVLIIRGYQSWDARFEFRIPLEHMFPVPSTLHHRHKQFWWSTLYLAVAIPLLASGIFTKYEREFTLWNTAGVLMFFGALMALAVVVATFQWVEWKVFRTDGSHDSVFIARRGPDKAQFSDFVAKLIHAIEVRRTLCLRCNCSVDVGSS